MEKIEKDIFEQLHISLSDAQKELFSVYFKELIRVNSFMNLTAITDELEVYVKHFYDSLILSQIGDFTQEKSLLDVGSGAGFPSIPLAIVYPKLKVTIIDALGKRINFLNELIQALGLTNVVCIHARAEDYAKKMREKFDFVTARAVARLNILSELCLPLTKVNGLFIAMKGDDGENELDEARNAIDILGGKVDRVLEHNLPFNMGRRNLIIIYKVRTTNLKYPRIFSKIKEKPL